MGTTEERGGRTVPPPAGRAVDHPPTATHLAAGTRFVRIAALLAGASAVVAVGAAVAGLPLWSVLLAGLLAVVLVAIAIQVGATAARARRVATDNPWVARRGRFGVEVRNVPSGRGGSSSQRVEVLVLEAEGGRPEAVCALSPVHWEGGPPSRGPSTCGWPASRRRAP